MGFTELRPERAESRNKSTTDEIKSACYPFLDPNVKRPYAKKYRRYFKILFGNSPNSVISYFDIISRCLNKKHWTLWCYLLNTGSFFCVWPDDMIIVVMFRTSSITQEQVGAEWICGDSWVWRCSVVVVVLFLSLRSFIFCFVR